MTTTMKPIDIQPFSLTLHYLLKKNKNNPQLTQFNITYQTVDYGRYHL
jgi:hypothetical protein